MCPSTVYRKAFEVEIFVVIQRLYGEIFAVATFILYVKKT